MRLNQHASPLARRTTIALGIFLAALFSFAQPAARQQPPDALPFAKNFLITGNYVTGSVDLGQQSTQNGTLTGTINMSGVPANADVLAAYLYWETIATNVAQVTNMKFRGQQINVAKVSSLSLNPYSAACWSGGGSTSNYTMTMFRADVKRLLPIEKDANGNPTGRVLVNNADLQTNNLPLTTITMPEAGTGNQTPSTAGATLLVIYRTPTDPLTSISVYDGIYIQPAGATMTQTLRGFLQSSTTHVAKMTHIVGSGAKNTTDRLFFKNSLIATDPFSSANTSSSDRFWSSPTYNVTSLLPGTDANDGYGETVTTSVDHSSNTPNDCLSWAAVVFSTTVQDTDADGIPDKLEETSGMRSPDGTLLPDFPAMGANKLRKDVFIELGAMQADAGTTYGVGAAQQIDNVGHNHLPKPNVLKMLGDAYKNAPVVNPDLTTGITLHVDAGPGYHGLGPEFVSAEADEYLIPPGLARGGELIKEVGCQSTATETCQFPNYPGTVSWKIGFQVLRDAPVGPTGLELTAAQMDACEESGDCRRRFDKNRQNFFRYGLYAHSRGKPKELCITGTPEQQATCRATNPDFHVPGTTSGIADLPGGDFMVTLGGWGHGFIGADFIQASTTMHELGHTFWRTHGGEMFPAIEGNCKPNYISVMNYLFQLTGLRDDNGVPHLDYSRAAHPALNETTLMEGVGPYPYRTAWYAPLLPGTVGFALGVTPATRFCSGAPFPSELPPGWVPMARLDALITGAPIDWNGDGSALGIVGLDISFDGQVSTSLNGSNDWANLRLDQVGSRRNMAGFSNGLDFTGFLDFGAGLDYTGFMNFDNGLDYTGFMDLGSGLDFTGFLSNDSGLDYTGFLDFGGGLDYTGFIDASGNGFEVELDRTIATATGNTPANVFAACVLGGIGANACAPADGTTPLHRNKTSWEDPFVPGVTSFSVFRTDGAFTPASVQTLVSGAPVPPTTFTLVDQTELVHGAQYTYWVKSQFADGNVNISNLKLITAENDAPIANNDTYNVNQGSTLSVTALLGVLANDTDTDSPSFTAVLDTAPAHASSFTLNANGSFTYTPAAGFAGTDTFTYKAKDVTPLSNRNVSATVTINVVDNTPPVVTVTIPTPNGLNGWFVTAPVQVTVSATDPSNVASFACTDNGSAIAVGTLSGIGTTSASGKVNVTNDGTHNLICTAKDGVNNSGAGPGSANTGTVKLDRVAPTISIVRAANNANIVLKTVMTASYTCTDPSPASGIASCTGTVANGANIDTATVGAKTFTVTAKDQAGNQSTITNTYLVIYDAILQALKTPATLNSAVGINWQLKDALGNTISSLSTLVKIESIFNGAAAPGGCSASATGIRETLYQVPIGSTGSSGFRLVSNGYTINWDTKTASTAPTITGVGCYTLALTFDDGQTKLTTAVQLK